jgi:hypothetical protein
MPDASLILLAMISIAIGSLFIVSATMACGGNALWEQNPAGFGPLMNTPLFSPFESGVRKGILPLTVV